MQSMYECKNPLGFSRWQRDCTREAIRPLGSPQPSSRTRFAISDAGKRNHRKYILHWARDARREVTAGQGDGFSKTVLEDSGWSECTENERERNKSERKNNKKIRDSTEHNRWVTFWFICQFVNSHARRNHHGIHAPTRVDEGTALEELAV